jgi:hypothetical protein
MIRLGCASQDPSRDEEGKPEPGKLCCDGAIFDKTFRHALRAAEPATGAAPSVALEHSLPDRPEGMSARHGVSPVRAKWV